MWNFSKNHEYGCTFWWQWPSVDLWPPSDLWIIVLEIKCHFLSSIIVSWTKQAINEHSIILWHNYSQKTIFYLKYSIFVSLHNFVNNFTIMLKKWKILHVLSFADTKHPGKMESTQNVLCDGYCGYLFPPNL